MATKRKSIVLTLVRCGDTAWETEERLHGRSDLPLSTGGRATVTDAAAWLSGRRIGTVYHPPDEAATETAQIIGKSVGARCKAIPELVEADLGVLDGLTRQALSERFPKRYKQWQEDPLTLSPPEGEDLMEARGRLFSAVSRLLRRSRSAEVAVVLHDLGLGSLRCWLADRPSNELWAMVARRPPVERYLVAMETISWLEQAAKSQYSHS